MGLRTIVATAYSQDREGTVEVIVPAMVSPPVILEHACYIPPMQFWVEESPRRRRN